MLEFPDFQMKQIIIARLDDGEKISFQNDNVLIKDKDGKVKLQSTCYRLFAIFLVGSASITTGLIQRARKFGFTIALFTYGFRLYEVIGGKREANTLLKKRQYDYDSIDIAKHIIKNKIYNQIQVLKQERKHCDEFSASIAKMQSCVLAIDDCADIHSIMGYEGIASKIYFKIFFGEFSWKMRIPRIKVDYINSILDIGYTILFEFMDAMLNIYGFDPYCGVLHTVFYMRKSLVCDIMEPFRVLIDKQIKKSLHLGQFKEDDFTIIEDKFQLKWEKSGLYTSVFLSAILARKEEIFYYIQQYYRCFMKQKEISLFPQFKV